MAVVVDGHSEEIPGLISTSWLDDPLLRLQIADHPDGQRDGKPRPAGARIQLIVLHTSRGIPGGLDHRPQSLRPGLGPKTDVGARSVRFWSTPGHQAGAHLVLGFDAHLYCTADLLRETTFHVGGAPGINDRSIGVEIEQGDDAELYLGQLYAAVSLCDWLTKRFHIQRQVPGPYRGRPCARLAAGGRDFVGIIGHRDADANRGAGDPGDAVMARLVGAGYESWDVDADGDLVAWRTRQAHLLVAADGVPGPATARALEQAGYIGGMWVPRPVDDGQARVG